jgi:prepilin-type N-terminal cleavage/methylation domain-containing protein
VTRTIRRPGFTLVELLVVIAIIATISAVAVGALFRIRTAQDKSNTEATLSKLDQKLSQKLKTISERVRDFRNKGNAQSSAALALAGDNPDITQALLMYAYTKNELPMSFNEAKANTVIGSLTIPASPVFAALPAGTGIPEESAVCLYLALSSLGTEGLEQQIGDAPNIPGQKCFIDQYGQPIYFNRLAYGGDGGTELDSPPFVKAPIAANTFDPYYPKAANTGGYRNLAAPTEFGVANTTALWTAVRLNTPAWANIPAAYPGLRNHTMTLISSGLNKTLAEPGGVYTGDNIVSYRLRREGQKGD